MKEKIIDLSIPQDAREYIANFKVKGHELTYVQTNSRKIYFNKMNDSEAVDVAHLLYDMEQKGIEKARNSLGLRGVQ